MSGKDQSSVSKRDIYVEIDQIKWTISLSQHTDHSQGKITKSQLNYRVFVVRHHLTLLVITVPP